MERDDGFADNIGKANSEITAHLEADMASAWVYLSIVTSSTLRAMLTRPPGGISAILLSLEAYV